MAALSADAIRDFRVTNNQSVDTFAIKTAATVYVGSLVAFTTIGRVQASTNATGLRPAGVVTEIVNESGAAITSALGNTGGTVKCKVAWGHEVLVDVRTAARTFINLGKTVYALTDNEITDSTAAGTAAVRVAIGSMVELNAAKTQAWIALRVYGDAVST